MDYAPITRSLRRRYGIRFRPASPEHLAEATKLGVPESVLGFYCQYEPTERVEAIACLCPLREMVVENHECVPGCDVHPHGYVVFATTICGDAYCFDLYSRGAAEQPRVVLLSHELDFAKMDTGNVRRFAKPVADGLLDFLQQMVDETLDQDPLYDD